MLHEYTFIQRRYNDKGTSEPVEEVSFFSKEVVTLEELTGLFEQFIKGCGFELPPGVHIGFEED